MGDTSTATGITVLLSQVGSLATLMGEVYSPSFSAASAIAFARRCTMAKSRCAL